MTEGQVAPEAEGSVYPLGKFLVLAELGRGGMAEVYLALARGPSGFNKLVVLKLLRLHLAEDEDFLRMFLAEARLAARLNHPNVVQTYEIGVEGGRNCIVMEYLEGRSFAEVEAGARPEGVPLSLGVRILADTLAGLHHAHELCDTDGRPLGLVHRDVSPHNVFVTYDGQVKILDFGIAKAADDGVRTKTGVFKGKLRYTAPERFAGEESDRRSDVFSVGVMLWQLLTKRRMWSGLNELGVMQQLASRTPVPAPRSIDPEIPARLDQICVKALATSPADRFSPSDVYHSNFAIALRTWSRVQVELSFPSAADGGPDAGTATETIYVNGVLQGTAETLTPPAGFDQRPSLLVGGVYGTSPTSGWAIRYDNVTLDLH